MNRILNFKSGIIKSANFETLFRTFNLLTKTSSFKMSQANLGFWSSTRYRSTSSKDKDGLGSSSIMLQDGLRFEELPVLVRTTHKIPGLENFDSEKIIDSHDVSSFESDAVCKIIRIHLSNITSVSEVLRYLQFIPSSDVTPTVALNVFQRIMELHHSHSEFSQTPARETFAETAVLGRLCETICRSSNHYVVLSGLDESNKITKLPQEEKARYSDAFVSECLLRANKGQLNLRQLCSFIESLNYAGVAYQTLGDNLWQEILNRDSEVTVDNISKVFGCLPFLKSSQRIILSMLEKKVFNIYPKLSERQIVHMMQIICLTKIRSHKLCYASTAWVNLNIHRVTEIGLRDLVTLLTLLNYSDHTLNKGIQRFMKARGEKCTDTLLMTTLADYCTKFRWGCADVMESISQYFVKYAHNLTPECISNLVAVFGNLNYEPTNAYQFFETLENTLTNRISQFLPGMSINMLLSCLYIQRYPLNFAKHIFQPQFLDKLNSEQNDILRRKSFNNLKLLDVALSLECPTYAGPFLPRNLNAKSIAKDSRLERITNMIENDMAEILGGLEYFRKSTVLPKLPLAEMYIVDFAIIVNEAGQPIPFDWKFGISKRIVGLILLPDHYVDYHNGTKRLIGSQAMRLRQLKIMGYEVVTLEYSLLEKLTRSRSELRTYLRERLATHIAID